MATQHRGHQAGASTDKDGPEPSLSFEPRVLRVPEDHSLGSGSVTAGSTQAEEVRCLSLQMSFLLSAGSVPLIRMSVRRIADAWGFDASLIDDAELVVSELSANAVLHSGATGWACFDVRLAPCACGLRIEVSDGIPSLPHLKQSKSTSERGRGLFLVEAVCRRWGVEEGGSGKVVWAEVGADTA
ncbi:ATP-binding protein [Kitasatospora sp. P5_F3]